MTLRRFLMIHSFLFLLIMIFSVERWPNVLLTIAQIILVPTMFYLVANKNGRLPKSYYYFALPAFAAVLILQWTVETVYDGVLSLLYLQFTFYIAFFGMKRFLRRGFIHFEEFLINMGLIHLVIGGIWFYVSEAKFPTGFPDIINWLTAIHFHYAACLLMIFLGFLGRVVTSRLYIWIGWIILLSPWLVALGITFSRWLELFSTIFYLIGISGIIYLSFRWKKSQNRWQLWLVRISFLALPITISFSLLYALGNVGGPVGLSIPFMLYFHGIMNCVLFGVFGVLGWLIKPPTSHWLPPTFRVSQIRGNRVIREEDIEHIRDNREVSGLIDQFPVQTVAEQIKDFYERTTDYRLFAKIQWRAWFFPFALVYRLWSRHIQQLNLPLSRTEVEMTGDVIAITEDVDGRKKPRAWIRKINKELTFLALYSEHEKNGKPYMNIALPLPGSSMIGILSFHEEGETLRLTSKREYPFDRDSGIYLATERFLLKLPLEEDFRVYPTRNEELRAEHHMWMFGIPFLSIQYRIKKKENQEG